MKQKTYSLAALVGCALIALSAVQPVLADGRRPSDIVFIAPEQGTVTQVIDGQTIQVDVEGVGSETVRYIGINAPAVGSCMGAQARNANSALMLGQPVRMQSDVVTDAPDYSYAWRYVYLLNGAMANEEMVRGGYAQAVSSPPNILNQGGLNNIEAAAVVARAGGWYFCGWKSSVARPAGTCLTITAEALNTRTDYVPEIGMLHDGDCVTIYKAANQDGPAWQGQYIYHPAGTVMSFTAMYLRWKDGVVAIMRDTDGSEIAHVVKHTVYVWIGNGYREVKGPDNVQNQHLIPDPGMPQMIEIPNPRTWLLQDMGNGQYKVLIDSFVYQSGDMHDMTLGGNGGLN
jgi:endonuclease YncB( thermonuclease family)